MSNRSHPHQHVLLCFSVLLTLTHVHTLIDTSERAVIVLVKETTSTGGFGPTASSYLV